MSVQVEPVAPLLQQRRPQEVLHLLQAAVPSPQEGPWQGLPPHSPLDEAKAPPHSPLDEAEAPLELMLVVRQKMSTLELVPRSAEGILASPLRLLPAPAWPSAGVLGLPGPTRLRGPPPCTFSWRYHGTGTVRGCQSSSLPPGQVTLRAVAPLRAPQVA